MKSRVLLMLGVVLPFSCIGLLAQDMESGHRPEPPQAGIHWAKGQAPTGQAGSSPNLLYHGGPVMGDVTVTPIFWGPSWGNQNWVGDKMTGLASFYTGINQSTYAATVGEYSDSANTPLTSNIAFLPGCHRSVPGQERPIDFANSGGSLQGDSESRCQWVLPGLYRYPAAQCRILCLAQRRHLQWETRAVRVFLQSGR